MKQDLVMYYSSPLEVIFAPEEREFLMNYIDNFRLNRLLQMNQEIIDKAQAGLYDII